MAFSKSVLKILSDISETRRPLEAIRDADQSNTSLDKILHLPVHSQKYAEMASTLANTCYEAELPLSMAAWNCDYATVDTLLEFGASIAAKNCQGDNIFHSLIKVWLS